MSEWKDGDEAMVTLYRVHGHLAEVECGDYLRTVHVECLHPLPTDPHQALKDAVIEAAKVWRQAQRTEKHLASAAIDLLQAADALTAAQTPPKPDPVEVFYQVTDGQSMCGPYGWKHCKDTRDVCYCRNNIASGLAAVEAARGAASKFVQGLYRLDAAVQLDALLAALPALGLKVMPVEATAEMANAAVDRTGAGGDMSWRNLSPQHLFREGHIAMLAAAPDLLGGGE